MSSAFDPTRHVLAVRVTIHRPISDSQLTGSWQVAGQPEDATHNQVLERNASVFSFLSPDRHDLHIRERLALNHAQLSFGYLPHPLPKNSRGQFLLLPERR